MKKKNVLVIDDEKEIVKTLKEILSEDNINVLTAYSGQEALDVFSKNNVSCIISDINMPKMSGVELIEKIRSIDKRIPFIFFTGFTNDDYIDKAIKHGAFDFIDKPDFSNVIEKVRLGILHYELNSFSFEEKVP